MSAKSLAVPVASTEWDSRADVLHHFYAYHFFDQGVAIATTLDLVNLDDADVQYFNRTSSITRGLKTGHKLAEYLSTPHAFKLSKHYPAQADEDHTANTYRRRFIHHVRAYNMTQEPRRRFYLLGLVDDDVEFLNGLEPGNGIIDYAKKLNFATDGCLGTRAIIAPDARVEDDVAKKIEAFMTIHRAQNTPEADDGVLEKSMSDLRLAFAGNKSKSK